MTLHAEFIAVPFMADIFMEELGIGCFSEINSCKYHDFVTLARQFREYTIGISVIKNRRLQSKSRESGRRRKK